MKLSINHPLIDKLISYGKKGMTLKEYLDISPDDYNIHIYGKNNLCICQATKKNHLETSKKLFNKRVIYMGLDENRNIVIVINKKVNIF